jgi:hypothetical protein
MLSRECGIFETPPDFVVDAPMRNGAAFLPCLLCCLSAAAADLDARRDAVMAELEALQPLLASPQNCQRIGFHGLAAEPAWIVIDHGGGDRCSPPGEMARGELAGILMGRLSPRPPHAPKTRHSVGTCVGPPRPSHKPSGRMGVATRRRALRPRPARFRSPPATRRTAARWRAQTRAAT